MCFKERFIAAIKKISMKSSKVKFSINGTAITTEALGIKELRISIISSFLSKLSTISLQDIE